MRSSSGVGHHQAIEEDGVRYRLMYFGEHLGDIEILADEDTAAKYYRDSLAPIVSDWVCNPDNLPPLAGLAGDVGGTEDDD